MLNSCLPSHCRIQKDLLLRCHLVSTWTTRISINWEFHLWVVFTLGRAYNCYVSVHFMFIQSFHKRKKLIAHSKNIYKGKQKLWQRLLADHDLLSKNYNCRDLELQQLDEKNWVFPTFSFAIVHKILGSIHSRNQSL